MAIRITGKLTDDIIKITTKYNSKINRLSKLGYKNLPNKVYWKDVYNSVKTKKDLNRELSYLQEFTKKGSEKTITLKSGLKITQYQYNIAKRQQRIAKNRATRRLNYLKSLESSEYGEKQGTYYYKMGNEQVMNIEARIKKLNQNLQNIKSLDYLDYLSNASLVDYSYRDKIYMSNYFDEMIFNLGYAVGFDKSKIQEMKDKIFNKLTDTQIARMMNSEEAIRSISEWYFIIHSRYTLNKTNIELVRNEYESLYESLDDIIKTYAD